MIMLDLQKAFDTVDHEILCQKLSAMGVVFVEWFHFYLSDRTQMVQYFFRLSQNNMWSVSG